MRHRLMHDKICHTCLRLLLEGQDTLQVALEEFCSLWCIRGELSTVNNHQSQICLLQSEKESDPHEERERKKQQTHPTGIRTGSLRYIHKRRSRGRNLNVPLQNTASLMLYLSRTPLRPSET